MEHVLQRSVPTASMRPGWITLPQISHFLVMLTTIQRLIVRRQEKDQILCAALLTGLQKR